MPFQDLPARLGAVRESIERARQRGGFGQTVTIGGVRARDGSLYGYMRTFTLPDGSSIELEAGGKETTP